jgi:hypothetical protein
MDQKNQKIFKLRNNYKYITNELPLWDMEGRVFGMHTLKNKTIFDDVKVSLEFLKLRILIDIPSSFLRPNPINHSTEVKTTPTNDTNLSITINDHDKHLMIITIPNNIPTLNWVPLEIHSSARWHPQTYIFIKSKYLFQWINYSDGSSRTDQTFFFNMKYENSSLISSDSMQSDDITTLAMDNITLNINVDNEYSDPINITVLSSFLVRKLGTIGKTHPSSMAPSNFNRIKLNHFFSMECE